MICITGIEIIDVSEDVAYIHNFDTEQLYANIITSGEIPKTVEVTEEVVQGRKFRNINGKTVCIGMGKEVQDALGLPFDAFNQLQSDLSDARNRAENALHQKYLLKDKIMGASLWQRIKYLFTGNL